MPIDIYFNIIVRTSIINYNVSLSWNEMLCKNKYIIPHIVLDVKCQYNSMYMAVWTYYKHITHTTILGTYSKCVHTISLYRIAIGIKNLLLHVLLVVFTI